MQFLYTAKPYLYWVGLLCFLLLEQKISYRPSTVSNGRRWTANIPLSLINGAIYHLVFTSTILATMETLSVNQIGLLQVLDIPAWLRIIAGILVLDCAIYFWHLLNHKVPLLWRFHRVHHCDMYMDVTTASRFHIGEFLLSGLVRLAVIYSFGIPIAAYVLFEVLVNMAIQFHHSSIRVNHGFEWIWHFLFVPPFLHRIHHSVKIKERDANYGVILSIWDRFFGTLRTDVDQDGIITGIGSHHDFGKLNFRNLLVMPFTRYTH